MPGRRAPGSRRARARESVAPRPAQRSTSRWSAAGELAQRRRADSAGPPPSSLERRRHRGVQHLGLVAQLARRLGDRALRRRRQLAQRVEHVVAHARAGEAAVGVRGVLAPVEPARAAGSRAPPRASPPAAAAPAARGAAPCPCSAREPGRDGQPVEHRLGLVGGRVRRRRSRRLGEPLGERVARVARLRLEVALGRQRRRARRAAARPARSQSRGRTASSASAPVAQPVVHVQRGHRGAQPDGQSSRQTESAAARTAAPAAARPRGSARSPSAASRRSLTPQRRDTRGRACAARRSPSASPGRCPRTSRCGASRDRVDRPSRVTSTSPPRARATTREARFTSRPK